VAVFGLHHIVSDGWSVGVLVRETAALYQGSSLPELPVQVADFAVWQRGWLQGEALAAQVQWWREALAGAPAVADLPLDRPRTGGSGPAGHVTTRLPQEQSAALRELARREGSTLFMVLLAAFQALLHRVTGDDDLVVGTPIANRTHPWLEGLIGFFVNTLALRSRLDEVDPSFRDLLRRTRTAALGAYAHQDLPFEKLVEELRVERSLRHSPVFQVMLVLQNAPMADLELPGLTLAPLPLAPGAAKFDLSLSFVDTESGLRAALEYDASAFDWSTAARLLHRLEAFLTVAATDPDCQLSALPVLGESEWHQVVVERGEPATSDPVLIHRRFEDWAARAPEALAIGLAERTITYGELDRAANRLAHAIRASGARLEMRVAVSVERPEGWALGMLAVFKAGAVYVPLDPRLPLGRLAYLLADSGASVLVTEEALLGRLPQGEIRIVCADRVTRFGPEVAPVVDIPSETLAYVIYTSGSTGTPKGVGVSHGALARQLDGAARRLDLRPGDRLLGTHADGFDASLEDTLTPLVAGAGLFPRGGELWSVSDVVKRIETWRITSVQMPTAYWRQVAAELDEAGRTLGPPLHCLEIGGEAMPVEAARQWMRVAPGARLLNGYGPTETVVTPTSFEVPPGFRETPSGTVPIGRPLAGRSALVVDRWGAIAPHGVAGEVWFGEPLARGYLGRPDATAAAFVPHPHPTIPGERLYRTGDRVRRLPDGNLEYLGRLDRQLKLRGFRIEPGEVEAALTGLPEVREAAVVVVANEPSGSRLVAFLVPRDSERPEPDLLRAALRGRLPDYMVPSAFVWLDALPLTGTGKVDRRELARCAERPEVPRTEAGQVAPRDDLERELAAIWEDLLGVRPVGVHDDFFALGGHSLLAVRLASRIEARFGRELPIAMLFERRTVEALAAWLPPKQAPRSASPLVRIQPGGDRQPLFLVHPGGGGVLCYAELARALGSDQPLFGLQAPGLDGDRPPLGEVGEMADLYLDAIRSAQPAGPWHLGGWSFGGLVAYEMACKLAERDASAGLVAILDTQPSGSESIPDETELLVRGLEEQFVKAVPFTTDELRGLSTRDQVALILDRARQAGQLPPDFDERRATGVVDVFKANLRAASSWRPRPYPGRITVFRATDRSHVDSQSGGWTDLAAVDVVIVPGDHLRMVAQPHVNSLARALREALDAWS